MVRFNEWNIENITNRAAIMAKTNCSNLTAIRFCANGIGCTLDDLTDAEVKLITEIVLAERANRAAAV